MEKQNDKVYLSSRFYDDNRVQDIQDEYGIRGTGILICAIFVLANNGYYAYSSDVQIEADRFRHEGDVNPVLDLAVKQGIFDKGLYDKYGILTNRQIQLEYISKASDNGVITNDNIVITNDNVIDERFSLVNKVDVGEDDNPLFKLIID